MKTMTCIQLGGACDLEFHASTFEEMAQLSQQHGREMFEKSDVDHMNAMEQMKEKMSDPKAMQEWMEKKHEEFDALAEDN